MTLYAYTGRSRSGESVSGHIDADTRDAVAARLFSNGVTPIDIQLPDAMGGSADLNVMWRRLGGGKPKISDLVLFSRQLYTITKSGIPLLRGLRGLVASTHNALLREALSDILTSLEAGRDLASSFARHPGIFPPIYISIVRVGEETGTLDSAFLRLSEYLAQDQDIQDRVRSAMRYPSIVIGTIGIAMGVISTFVIPRFAPLFEALGNNIPWPTRVIMAVSSFTQNYWYVVMLVMAATTIGVRQYVKTERGRYVWHKYKLRIPALGKLAHEAILSRISRSLSISLTAGMPMIQTLHVIAQSAGNDYMADHVHRMREGVERGDPLSRAAATVGMFPPLVLQMLQVGEETGEMSELLDEVAGFYEREVDYSLKNITSAIEPILIVCVGGMVLILALGVFLPMWEMISKVGGQ
jgi:MSHA biogenesis protein MshG